jgi:hypothetical protein
VRSGSALTAAALFAMASGLMPTAGPSKTLPAGAATPSLTAQNDRAPGPMQRSLPAEAMRRMFGGAPRTSPTPWPSREGWSNRRYQRAAAKRRAKSNNRRNHRGS